MKSISRIIRTEIYKQCLQVKSLKAKTRAVKGSKVKIKIDK